MTTDSRCTNRFLNWLPALLLGANAILLVFSIHQHSVTFDEAGHIGSGVMSWRTKTYNAYRVNPPTTRMLATLPLMASDVELPPDSAAQAGEPQDRVEWQLGRAFADLNREHYPELVRCARYIGIIWSLLGGWVLFRWCRELYGFKGACLALAMWCFEPNLMAHAQLATPDFPCAVAALLAAYFLWQYLRRPHWSAAWLAGLALGFALLTKFTLLVFVPLWLILVLCVRRVETRSIRSGRRLVHFGLLTLAALFVINLGYGFQATGERLGHTPFVSRTFAGEARQPALYPELIGAGNRFAGTWLEDLPLPVPADFARGIDVQRRDFEEMHKSRQSYLAGQWQERGWWYYYLYVLAVKLPVGILALVLSAFLLALVRHRSSAMWQSELIVYIPGIAILVLVSSQTGFNHHGRYALPVLPFAILGAGKLGYFLMRRHWKMAIAIVILSIWTIISVARVFPHNLSYFNEFAGGPENGDAHLLDSNIDWGQDLNYLKKWIDAHPDVGPLHVKSFSLVDERVYGLERFTAPPPGTGFAPPEICGPQPGWHILSVNYLHGMPQGNQPHEYSYFQQFTPVDRIGYSMRVYHISEQEANRVRAEIGLPALVERRE